MISRKTKRFLTLSVLVLFLAFLTAVTVIFFAPGISKKLQREKLTNIKQTTVIYDCENQPVANIYGSQNRINVDISTLPAHVKNAFVAAEDIRFYSHNGYDLKRIFGALLEDIKSGSYKQGASTISQQLIKNSHLSGEKTVLRKLHEVSLSIQLEKEYSKDEILEMYMNLIYFGNGAYGIEAAANTYFDKSAAELTVSEAAMLAGVIKAPSTYAPHIKYDNALSRRNVILGIMLEQGFINEDAYQTAKNETIQIADKDTAYPYGYFTDMVIEEACALLDVSVEELISGGYRIYSTMDTELQTQVEKLAANDKYFPKCQTDTLPQCSIVVMDNTNGEIRALVGGREHTTRLALNRATDVKRQPGSTIKPLIVYAPALEEGLISTATPILDEKINIGGYTPKNFNHQFNGWVSVRKALASSLNIPAVKLLNTLGVEKGKSFAESLGIEFEENDDHLALALGGMSLGATPLQISNAYQGFANGGERIESSCIRMIQNHQGQTLYSSSPKRTRVMSAETAFLINDMLITAAQKAGGSLEDLPFPVAAKTGTVGLTGKTGFKDAWMASYNTEYSIVAHIGYDKTDSKHYLPETATGSTYPAYMCKALFEFIYDEKEPPTFTPPMGIVTKRLDRRALETEHSVELATIYTPQENVVQEYFAARYAPTQDSVYHNVPTPPEEFTVSLNGTFPEIRLQASADYVEYSIYKRAVFGDAALLHTVTGQQGETLSITDTDVISGQIYEYYVLPKHKELQYGGTALCGPVSQSVSIVIPYQ